MTRPFGHRPRNYIARGFCEQCGKPRPERSHVEGKFCGRVCAALAARHVVPTLCHVCGVVVSRGAIACYRHLHAKKQITRQRTCVHCGTIFSPVPSAIARAAAKYCSLKCYRIVAAERPAFLRLQCPECGKAFRRSAGAIKRNKASYCSMACSAKANSGERSANWRGGSDPNRGQGWRQIAEQIRIRDGYRCRRCGKTQEQNRQRLSVDHVIPWRTFASAEEANQFSNLVSLCRPCHSRKGRAERLWLQGDVLDMWRYQVAVAEPWNVAHPNDGAGVIQAELAR